MKWSSIGVRFEKELLFTFELGFGKVVISLVVFDEIVMCCFASLEVQWFERLEQGIFKFGNWSV